MLWLLFTGLILILAILSASETALLSVNKVRIRQMAVTGPRQFKTVSRLINKPHDFLTSLLILENLITVVVSAIATVLFVSLNPKQGVLWATLFTTVVLLVFGEVTPKNIASRSPERISLWVGPLVAAITYVLRPVDAVLLRLTGLLLRLLRLTEAKSQFSITEAEIRYLVDVGQEEGQIDGVEGSMIDSIFELDDKSVGEIMVPRTDMIGMNVQATVAEAISAIQSSGHSRLPVYRQSLDDIVGILYAKDLLHVDETLGVESLLRSAHYTPESKKIDELLHELKMLHTHMVIVIDEYGGTAGLVTIEDMLEEIVGDIFDEYDQNESAFVEIDPRHYKINPRVSLHEFAEKFALPLNQATYHTLGGLIMDYMGRLPKEGEEIHLPGLVLRVERVIGRKLVEVVVEIKEEHG